MDSIARDVKKIRIILLAVALLGATTAYAQQSWSAGVGYSSTTFNGTDCSQFLAKHPLKGFYAGVSHEFYFSALAGLTFEPGLYFHYQSGRNDAEMKPKYIKMHYLSIPMDLKYSFNIATGAMGSLFTGPVLNIGLIGNLYDKGTFKEQGGLAKDATDLRGLTRANLQWRVGAAVTVAEAVQLRFSYAFGISRLIPEQELHNNALTVGLGLLF